MAPKLETNLLALECVKCEVKFRRSPVADWNSFVTGGKCFECFVSDSLGGPTIDLIFVGTRGRMMIQGCPDRLAIAARDAKTRQWYVLTYSQQVIVFPPDAPFYEGYEDGNQTKVS